MIEIGQSIGNYKITAKLGEGGMGVVYLAEHPVIGRKVALKAIHPELSRNPEVVSRFMTEAKSVNQIGNEHIVDVNDFGTTTEGEFYFIMEFLQGESLADRLRRERCFEPHRAMQIAAQVADALAASHGHGIIHRDLKPENIFLIPRGQSRDFVKVLDFGLAKLIQGEEKVSHKTRTGSVMGTPYYMAPEQCEGKSALDHRADIYSLGVIVFEMLTGEVPFGGEGYGEIIVKHLTQPPRSPRALNPAITLAQQAVVMRALAKSRDDRFASMEAFRAAMLDPEQFLAAGESMGNRAPAITISDAEAARPDPMPPVDSSVSRRVPVPSTFRHGAGELMDEDITLPRSRKGLVVGGVLAALAAGVAALMIMRRPEPPNAPPPVVAAESPNGAPPPAGDTTNDRPAERAGDKPEMVKLSFSSEPAGAAVVLKSSGAVLGTTPFDHELPAGHDPVALVFRKEGFEDREISAVPSATTAPLSATLRPLHAEPQAAPVGEEPTSSHGARPSAAKASTHKSGTSRPRKPTAKPLDDDAVLEPSFKY